MRCFTVSAFLILAAFTTAPGNARIAGNHPPREVVPANPFPEPRSLGPGIGRDLRDIRNRVDNDRERGVISKREARQLKREARLISRLERRYSRDGLSASERKELEDRARYLRDAANRPRT